MKIIGKTTFGTIFLCFLLSATVTNASAQDPRTLTEEEQVFDPKDETQVDLTTTQVPPETEEATEGE